MGAKKTKGKERVVPVEDYEHSEAKRTNNPPAGLAHLDRDETPLKTLSYDPHLDPQLVWAGKAERSEVEVPAPSIHVHEELSAQKIIDSVRRQRTQQPLFDVDKLDLDQAVEFYQHDMGWSNRMILGDSLMVMSSLLERERMAGQVQCVYIDPPYGIKYNSNFQPGIANRQVKDGRDDDLTREPEMIQAYRDTWELGVHSYLSYLRDRLVAARELLTDSGSVFVQISDENVHLVRTLLDEVFGYGNFISHIVFTKTTGLSAKRKLPGRFDHLLWYGKDRDATAMYPVYERQAPLESGFRSLELPNGEIRSLTKKERSGVDPTPDGARLCTFTDLGAMGPGSFYEVEFEGETFTPATGWWGVPEESMKALIKMGRVVKRGKTLRFKRYFEDFPYTEISNLWLGFGGVVGKKYIVETNKDVVARCLTLASAPGDLVLDPTCGSGTTATAAELLGRRWITIDTSRVALSIARENLLTAVYPYYRLRDESRGVDGGMEYKTVIRFRRAAIAKGEEPDEVVLYTEPKEDGRKTRVSGPFTGEAISRYTESVDDDAQPIRQAPDHVPLLLAALRARGIPRPGASPYEIESLEAIAATGPLQAEGVLASDDGAHRKFAVSFGPQFGAITLAQVSDALRHELAIGFDLVVFAGFAVSSEAQEKLAEGRLGSTDVSLLIANPDLLVGDLLKNTSASQTFRLYVAPDVEVSANDGTFTVHVNGVDSFDAATGEVISFGRSGVQAWFVDDDFDGTVFRVSQALFPVTDAWSQLEKALRGTIDAERVSLMHGWTSLPFDRGEHGRIAVRVIADDGNASEVILKLPEDE